MELAIVTGASRGLGRVIVTSFLQRDIQVVGIARGVVENMDRYTHIQADLSDLEQVSTVIEQLIETVTVTKPSKLYVFHNASIIEPIERVGHLSAADITKAFHVNTLAPMIITNELIKLLTDLQIQILVVNITSGAAERPISGWSVYNSTKAAINMYTQVTGLEQNNSGNSHIMIAFSPGVMDTDMQEIIRSSDERAFRDVTQFQKYKEDGNLRSPEEVGEALVRFIYNERLENGRIYYVKELL